MANEIITNILRHLQRVGEGRKLAELHLTRFFTTVELDDSSVGACMSYYSLPDVTLGALERRLERECVSSRTIDTIDAFTRVVCDEISDTYQCTCLVAALMTAVASALSAPFIRDGGDTWFEVKRKRPFDWLNGAETALVVGFGGFLEPLIAESDTKRVHVIDLIYKHKAVEFDSQIASWTAQHPGKSITISSQLAKPSDFKEFDLLSITGSTLGNGTLEYVLGNVRHDATVILQGQSASLHPKILFESGIKWVATTLKPHFLGRLARGGHGGEEMRPLLQGGLPWIYFLPRQLSPQ